MKAYAHAHPLAFLACLLWACVSAGLIGQMWLAHRRDGLARRLLWTLLLLVPFVGWVFYGAFYTPLAENSVTAEPCQPGAGQGG